MTGSIGSYAVDVQIAADQQADYAFILGEYLGDGWLDVHSPKSQRLLIVQDTKYTHSIQEIASALQRLFPDKHITIRDVKDGGCTHVGVCSTRLLEMFPQHGRGKKHDRDIKLKGWQEAIVQRHPRQFLKGLLWSDGCRYTQLQWGKYSYPRYVFTQRSPQIFELFLRACNLASVVIGSIYRSPERNQAFITAASSVRLLDHSVGPKSGHSTAEYWQRYDAANKAREERRKERASHVCASCSSPIQHTSTHCVRCIPRSSKIDWPSAETLVELVQDSGFSCVGRKLDVSDNAIRKRLLREGIDPKTLQPIQSDELRD